MKLERVELFVVRLPLKRAYETSGSRETHQTHVLARVQMAKCQQQLGTRNFARNVLLLMPNNREAVVKLCIRRIGRDRYE